MLAAPAFADAPAAALVRLLASPGRPHPLADAKDRVPFTVVLPAGASASALGLLLVAPGIGAARLAPAGVAAFAAEHPDLYLGLEPPRRPLLDVSRGLIHLDAFRAATGADGTGVIVGIVDTGIDVRHKDFLDQKGKTRIAWLLNAEPPRGVHPELERDFGCDQAQQSQCAVYDAADIDALIAQGSTAIRDVQGHGTHVTSIAAGNGGISVHEKPAYAGVAPGATLVIANPSSDGDFFDADVLRAASFVFNRADALQKPVVCNLSLGGDFGPHDGTSALEKGLSAMVGDDKPGRAVVVAAGNSGALVENGDGPSSGIHTEARVTAGGVTRVPLRANRSTKGKGFIWITFRPGDVVDVALEGPDGSRWIGFTSPGHEAGFDDKKGTTAGVVNNNISKSSSITSDTNSAVVVVQGAWPDRSEFNVLLRGTGDASLWVVGTGDVGGPTSGILFERAIRQGTVTVPASAPGLLAVGCTLSRLAWKPLGSPAIVLGGRDDEEAPRADGACYFSASGPTPLGVMKPEISAPGGFIIGAMSSEADPRTIQGGLFDSSGCPDPAKPCFVIDEDHAITTGTSMSAPQVAGAIALLMQSDPTLTQGRVTDILQAGARKPTGRVPYDYQLGPGVLDLEGARQALAAEPLPWNGAAPDRSKSWYTLSSPYAQPNDAFPVWGTIELRRADGSLASGLDGTLLSVAVKNGAVVRPLVKVRHGLFRFAVAGAAGHVGEAMTVNVLYGNDSLGVRTLPIGTDVWTADGVVDAVGGCSLSVAAGRAGWASGLAVACGLALAFARRRARG